MLILSFIELHNTAECQVCDKQSKQVVRIGIFAIHPLKLFHYKTKEEGNSGLSDLAEL